ncbi:MAG: hypothetical protein RJA36_2626 [Pseudomonadota bacterium]
MPLESIIYVSSAEHDLADEELERLLLAARRRNQENGVTGALLYHDAMFFQYLEGPSSGVREVYGHIQRSQLHHGLIELARSPIAERAFPAWFMGFTRAPASTILRLSNASWKAAVHGQGAAQPMSEGMILLLDFWRSGGG